MKRLNPTEAFVLDCLQNSGHPGKWMRPMDLGRPSSYIWRGLNGLVAKGLVERKLRGGHAPGERGPYVYRLAEPSEELNV